MSDAGPDRPYLAALRARWGMDKLADVAGYPRTAIYQWRPSRSRVPADAALRVCEMPDAMALGYFVERLCPHMPWHLLYRGRDRRNGHGRLNVSAAVKAVGVSALALAAGRSRQNVYNALGNASCPVWLAFAIERASDARFLVEDFRPDLPWWPLYERRKITYPLRLAA